MSQNESFNDQPDLLKLREEMKDNKRRDEAIKRIEDGPDSRRKAQEWFEGLEPVPEEEKPRLDALIKKAFKEGILMYHLEQDQPSDN